MRRNACRNPLLQPWKGVRAEDLLVDAVLGIAMFKARLLLCTCCSSAYLMVDAVLGIAMFKARLLLLLQTLWGGHCHAQGEPALRMHIFMQTALLLRIRPPCSLRSYLPAICMELPCLQVMGGRFRSVMPSDLSKVGSWFCIGPGALWCGVQQSAPAVASSGTWHCSRCMRRPSAGGCRFAWPHCNRRMRQQHRGNLPCGIAASHCLSRWARLRGRACLPRTLSTQQTPAGWSWRATSAGWLQLVRVACWKRCMQCRCAALQFQCRCSPRFLAPAPHTNAGTAATTAARGAARSLGTTCRLTSEPSGWPKGQQPHCSSMPFGGFLHAHSTSSLHSGLPARLPSSATHRYVKQYIATAKRSLLSNPYMRQVSSYKRAAVPAWRQERHRAVMPGCVGTGWFRFRLQTEQAVHARCFEQAHLPMPCQASLPPAPPVLLQMASALNIQTGTPRQRYYPQCTSCMQKQSSAIRNDKVGSGSWGGGRCLLHSRPIKCRIELGCRCKVWPHG